MAMCARFLTQMTTHRGRRVAPMRVRPVPHLSHLRILRSDWSITDPVSLGFKITGGVAGLSGRPQQHAQFRALVTVTCLSLEPLRLPFQMVPATLL